MSVSEPSDSCPVRGKGGSSMRLSLHSEADHNGNTFPMWSSSSSSSSSLGESSPEMLQRSFSGGQSDSPLDYDMVEVTLVTAVVAEMNRVTDVMISKWTTEKDSKQDGEDDVSTEKIQRTAELSECDDNSMSVYLDANGEDTWNSGRGRRPSSTTPYLDATEIPDDDDEEALFLSLTFDVGVQNSVSLTNTTSQVMGGGCALENVDKVDCALEPSVDSKADLPLSPQSFPSPSPAPDPREVPSTLRSKSIQQQTSHMVRTAKTKAVTGTLRSTRPVGCPGIKPSTAQAKLSSPCKNPHQRDKPAALVGKDASQRVKSCNVKTPSKTAAAICRALSASASSLGSEMVEERSMDTQTVENVLDKQGTTEDVGIRHSSDTASEQFVEKKAVNVAKAKSQSRKVGPNARQHGRGCRVGKAASPAGPSAEHLALGRVQKDVLGEVPQTGQTPSQSRVNSKAPSPASSALTESPNRALGSRPTASQLPGRPSPTASRLPVKGLPPSLGSNEKDAATSKVPASTGTKPDEWPNRSTVPACSQRTAKPPGSSAPSAPSRPPAMRTRAVSSQAGTTAAGLKATSPTSLTTTKVTAASQGLSKQTCQFPLQRSGSTRLSRPSGSVDKNKPREAPARPTNANSGSQVAACTGGTSQNQHQPPPDLVADVVNSNAAMTSVPLTGSSNIDSGSTVTAVHGFKARTASRSSHKTGSRIHSVSSPATVQAKQSKEQMEKGNQSINQLKRLLVQGNRRVEALAMVIQHLFTEREEALKQKKDLLLELEKLRAELAASAQCYERLQKEKEEARLGVEESLKRQEQQHKEELVQLEDRLRRFYQTEWDKVHQTYQEEADKCRRLMEQQVEQLRSQQEAERKEQEVGHSQMMKAVKQQYEMSIQELKSIQQTDMENLERILKDTESSLSEQICELSAEKASLNEKLQAEEERRRRILSDKNLKDSHTLYLEQELESLKVVLEIKNNQLHQKEKKLMEMDKVVETNVKLEECLKKVQQENEDYRARMDKHAAISKQLSSEQAILQQTLQKESKVNKRLSMENEELLWKLHNGDLLASPRHMSPTSPFSSPSSTAPLSPR